MKKTLFQYYKECLGEKFADFDGRATRAEYGGFWLINLAVYAGIGGALGLLVWLGKGSDSKILAAVGFGLLIFIPIYFMYALIPLFAVDVRRLHDLNFSGWLLLIGLIPGIGQLMWLFFFLARLIIEGTRGTNDYGADPKAKKQANKGPVKVL